MIEKERKKARDSKQSNEKAPNNTGKLNAKRPQHNAGVNRQAECNTTAYDSINQSTNKKLYAHYCWLDGVCCHMRPRHNEK